MGQGSHDVQLPRAWRSLVVAWLLLAALVVAVQIGGYFLWPSAPLGWIALGTTSAVVAPMLVAIVIVGANSESEPWIRRDSVLWRWVRGVGAAFSASAGLGIGALLGAIIGAGVATGSTINDLETPAIAVVTVVAASVFAAVLWWSAVVAVDVYRLGRKRRAQAARLIFGAKNKRRKRHAKAAVFVISELSGPLEVGLCGLLLLMLTAQLWALTYTSLAAG